MYKTIYFAGSSLKPYCQLGHAGLGVVSAIMMLICHFWTNVRTGVNDVSWKYRSKITQLQFNNTVEITIIINT